MGNFGRFVGRIFGFVVAVVLISWATTTTINKVAITNSTINSTTIGATTTSTGAFTQVTASGAPGFTGSLLGNASTASTLNATPSQCSTNTALVQGGIDVTGAPMSCGPALRYGILSGASCTTGSSTYSTCTSSGNWNSNFPGVGTVYVACIPQSVSDPRAVVHTASGTQTGFTFEVVTEGSVAVNVSNTTCIGVQT